MDMFNPVLAISQASLNLLWYEHPADSWTEPCFLLDRKGVARARFEGESDLHSIEGSEGVLGIEVS